LCLKRVIENFIQEDQYELMKEVQKVKEATNEGKWALIGSTKSIIRDRAQKDNNKQEFEIFVILSWNSHGFPWRKGLCLVLSLKKLILHFLENIRSLT